MNFMWQYLETTASERTIWDQSRVIIKNNFTSQEIIEQLKEETGIHLQEADNNTDPMAAPVS